MSRKHTPLGYLPCKEELIKAVEDLGECLYAGRFVPNKRVFDDNRPAGWRLAVSILKAYGFERSSEGWRQMLRALGLDRPQPPFGAILHHGWRKGSGEGPKQGLLPRQDELIDAVNDISERFYAGQFLPGISLFDQHRPAGWRAARGIQRAYGFKIDAEGWRHLLQELGFETPMAPVGVGICRSIVDIRKERTLDEPIQHRYAVEHREAEEESYGLQVIERWRTVRCWSIKRHRYLAIGRRLVMEVR